MVLPGVGSSKCLVGYLPRSKQRSIIFTTSNRKVTTNGYVQDMEVPNILDEEFCDAAKHIVISAMQLWRHGLFYSSRCIVMTIWQLSICH